MTTLKDVALKAGVSPKTVSRILNKEQNVAKATREKVEAVIKELDFRPNLSARVMRTGKTGLVGIITHQALRQPWSGDLMSGLFEGLEKGKKRPLITQISEYDDLEAAINLLRDQAVEGIIYTAMYHHGIALPKVAHKLPFVICNGYDEAGHVASVVPDDYLGGSLAAQHLVDKGYRKIAYLGLAEEIDAGKLRGKAFKDVMMKSQMNIADDFYRQGEIFLAPNQSENIAIEILQSWYEQNNMPDAIVVGQDQMAMTVMTFVQQKGISIPRDLAVMGYDNHTPIAAYTYPPLTTIDIAYHKVGVVSAETLLLCIKGEATNHAQLIKIPAHLVERGSA